ncbi:MAG: Na+/H+ antiporter NhaC family protein [Kiritimatiellia bacterium]
METYAGFWTVLPPLLAIALALLTREIVLSLSVAIFSGVLVYVARGFGTFDAALRLIGRRLAQDEHLTIILFLMILGALVSVITRAGGARAYGIWAGRRLRDERAVGLMTILMGLIIFIDDYFNCLSVGTVMRPVADKFKMSRAKLAYLIDTTAAPVCILVPVSSWAAFVISCLPQEMQATGMRMFISSAPLNFYAIFSLFMVFWIAMKRNSDFGLMARMERTSHAHRDVGAEVVMREGLEGIPVSDRGTVADLIAPVIALIGFSAWFLTRYEDAGEALAFAAIVTLAGTFLLLVPRKVIDYHEFAAALLFGVKTMVPAIVLLMLAWGVSAVCNDLLGTGSCIASALVAIDADPAFLPVTMFILSVAFTFATGASWAAIGILVPIGMSVCLKAAPDAAVITLAATLAGSVMGDHCSPIADTTILSSTGAQCKHLNHVMTQIPYAAFAGAFAALGYLIAGLLYTRGYGMTLGWGLGATFAALLLTLIVLSRRIRMVRTAKSAPRP